MCLENYGNKIKIYGSRKNINICKEALDEISLTGIEQADRVLIQNMIDEKAIKADIFYDGNFVVPFTKTVKEFKKYNKSNNIDKMTDYFYKFLTVTLGDIAHYDKHGYIYYYRDFESIKSNLINLAYAPGWYTDLKKVLDVIKEY